MSNENNQGYVYTLTYPSFREKWVKIRKSSRPVDVRYEELNNTAVPLPLEIHATVKTAKHDKVKRQIHFTAEFLPEEIQNSSGVYQRAKFSTTKVEC